MILILLGGAFLLHNMRILHLEDTLRFWPAALILMGLVQLLNHGFFKVGGHVLILVGSGLLAGFLGYEHWIERFWPAGIIYIGLLVTARALTRSPKPPQPEVIDAPRPLSPESSEPQDDQVRL